MWLGDHTKIGGSPAHHMRAAGNSGSLPWTTGEDGALLGLDPGLWLEGSPHLLLHCWGNSLGLTL